MVPELISTTKSVAKDVNPDEFKTVITSAALLPSIFANVVLSILIFSVVTASRAINSAAVASVSVTLIVNA